MVRKILDNKIIRYFFSAGTATAVDISVYFVAFNFIYQKQDIHIFKFTVLSAPTASLILSYTCGLITNFLITKYLVFKESDLRGIHQLLRYILVALFILILNYFFMSFLIKTLDWFPTLARIVSALSIGILSFVIHKFYSFKVTNK
ncbi:MAG: GtrA family protein [Bacteroidetes bacterium]|nr:GtrA family protein [Bacteroidota bacterium]